VSFRLKWTLALRDSDQPSTAKHVGLNLSLRMDADGYCYPGRALQSRETSLDTRTIDRAIVRLETGGWLKVKHSTGKHVNEYWATLPNSGTESPLTAAQSHGNGGRNDTQTAAQSRPNSSVNSSLNSSVCPECGIGGGRHIADCELAPRTPRPRAIEGTCLNDNDPP
jgi:hypothetical protein